MQPNHLPNTKNLLSKFANINRRCQAKAELLCSALRKSSVFWSGRNNLPQHKPCAVFDTAGDFGKGRRVASQRSANASAICLKLGEQKEKEGRQQEPERFLLFLGLS